MRTTLITIFIFLISFSCFSQDALKTKSSRIFSDVQYLHLIQYSNTISAGINYYENCFIKRRKKDFLIKATSSGKQLYSWTIPFPGIEKEMNIDTAQTTKKSKLLINAYVGRYVSEKQIYKLDDTSYLIYKHINYNCYDPYCGTKHNHVTGITGETYFSPAFGILVHVDNQHAQFNLLFKMKEKKVPHNVVIEILKSRKTDENIMQAYIRKISE